MNKTLISYAESSRTKQHGLGLMAQSGFIFIRKKGVMSVMNTKDKLVTVESLKAVYDSVNSDTDSKLSAKQDLVRTIAVVLKAGEWTVEEDGVTIWQEVVAEGVTEASLLLVSPSPESADEYAAYIEAGVYCSGQGNGTITFRCASEPVLVSEDEETETSVTVNIAII